ncbi:MAG: SPOR domain-containing protein [Bacteroidales bacterium]
MRKVIALFLTLSLTSTIIVAQSFRADSTIVSHLERHIIGQGDVLIRQSKAIELLIGRRQQGENQTMSQVDGYRVQLFSGNQQNSSKNEAFSKEQRVRSMFPEIETYVTFKSPFWRLRIGNFRSYEDADQMMRRMKRAFPDFSREMYVVRDEIKLEL